MVKPGWPDFRSTPPPGLAIGWAPLAALCAVLGAAYRPSGRGVNCCGVALA
jgi:hypothetical protein